MLLLLDFSDLVSVRITPRPMPVLSTRAQEPPGFTQEPLPRPSLPVHPDGLRLFAQKLRVAGTSRHVVILILPRRPVRQAVGIRRRLPVTKVRTMSTPPDPPSDATLLDRLANHHTILLKLFR